MRVHPATLPVLSGLSIAGAAIGVVLGNSAISEINPIYYKQPETRFHADLVPYRSPSAGQGTAMVQEAALTPGALGTGCVGCRTYPEEYFPQHDGSADGYSASAWEPDEEAGAQYAVYEAAEAAQPDPRMAAIELYSRYRVSQDEPERVRAAPEPAPPVEIPEGEQVALGM
jgi:hypothetical protein